MDLISIKYHICPTLSSRNAVASCYCTQN
jgi:hypothetical protein